MQNKMTELIPAKLFEGELWVKASDHQRAIKEALAQPSGSVEQEPVEWGVDWGPEGNSVSIIKRLAGGGIEVVGWEYAPHPPQRTAAEGEDKRTWIGLTYWERKKIEKQSIFVEGAIRMTEAKLKEKNT